MIVFAGVFRCCTFSARPGQRYKHFEEGICIKADPFFIAQSGGSSSPCDRIRYDFNITPHAHVVAKKSLYSKHVNQQWVFKSTFPAEENLRISDLV